MLLLSCDDAQSLRHALPALADLPTAGMPLSQPASALPPLSWQVPAARAAMVQLLAAGEWLQVGTLLPNELCCFACSVQWWHVAVSVGSTSRVDIRLSALPACDSLARAVVLCSSCFFQH